MKINAFADERGNTINEQIYAIQKHNLNGIEIRYVNGKNIIYLDMDEVIECSRKLREEKIQVWSIASPIGKMSLNTSLESQIGLLNHSITIAKILNTNYIRLFSYFPILDKSEEWNITHIIERLQLFVDIAKQKGITLCLENEKDTFCSTAERCLQVLESTPGLKGVFDPANFIACGQDTINAWNMLKKHIEYLHIKDALEDGTITLPGYGVGHIKFIFREFMNQGGKGVTIEPHLKSLPFFNELELYSKSRIIDVEDRKEDLFDKACVSFISDIGGMC